MSVLMRSFGTKASFFPIGAAGYEFRKPWLSRCVHRNCQIFTGPLPKIAAVLRAGIATVERTIPRLAA
jgi:hypothetical protein